MFSIRNELCLEAEKLFENAAILNKGKIQFTLSHPDDGFGKFERLAEHVGIETIRSPQIIIVRPISGEQVDKYLYNRSNISVENISLFIDDYLKGKVEKYYKSEVPLDT